MEQIMNKIQENRDFLDDCVAAVEVLKCLQDKGAEAIDTYGVTLEQKVFDQCFPGMEWREETILNGQPTGIRVKKTEYRGIEFDTLLLEEEEAAQ